MTNSITFPNNGAPYPLNASSCLAKGEDLLKSAKEAPTAEEKKALFNEAYKLLKPRILVKQSTEEKMLFSSLLETYSKSFLYNIEENGNRHIGFRKSAALLDFSFINLLHELNLSNYHHFDGATIDDLISDLSRSNETPGQLFESLLELNIDPKVLFQKADDLGLRDTLADTLILLTFSYQNFQPIPLPQEKWLAFQEKLQSLTEAVCGEINDQATPENRFKAINFQYNRAVYLSDLRSPNNYELKMKSYDKVIGYIEKFKSDNPLKYQSLLAQIANMKGGTTYRKLKELIDKNEKSEINKYLRSAEDYLMDALTTRVKVLNLTTNEEDLFWQKYLLANSKSFLIATLLIKAEPLTRISTLTPNQKLEVLEALGNPAKYAKDLTLFLTDPKAQESGYKGSWESAIKLTEDFLKKIS